MPKDCNEFMGKMGI